MEANAPDPDDLLPVEGGFALRVRVLNDQGLHARPAARLAQEAQKFACDIRLVHGGEAVDAKSILDILTLAAGQGSELELRASGPEGQGRPVPSGRADPQPLPVSRRPWQRTNRTAARAPIAAIPRPAARPKDHPGHGNP